MRTEMAITDEARLHKGYQHASYAESLAEFGTPRLLPRSGGWVLERSIDGLPYRDLMGCYPLFSCEDWSGLNADLDELLNDFAALALVADPFGHYDVDDLRRCFNYKFVPFKTHFVADLRRPAKEFVSEHHRTYARQALRDVVVERCDEPASFLDVWVDLYATLTARHQLMGIKKFSRDAFSRQLNVPGIVMLRAIRDGETVGAHLWYVQSDVVHSHLAASSAGGYELMASYALYWYAIETFADTARWLNFGGGAGVGSDRTDGLTKFKKGWATHTRTAYFCGRVLDRQKYAHAISARGISRGDYFPAYRSGELA
jgi:hypothetical protein